MSMQFHAIAAEWPSIFLSDITMQNIEVPDLFLTLLLRLDINPQCFANYLFFQSSLLVATFALNLWSKGNTLTSKLMQDPGNLR